MGRKWHNVAVEVKDKTATAYLNNKKIVSFPTYFTPGGYYGAIVANGYKNTVYFKDLRSTQLPGRLQSAVFALFIILPFESN